MRFKVVALLESMWGWRGYHQAQELAPRFYRINSENTSGRRLYRLCGDANLIVTNSCPVIQRSANDHGIPDADYVAENLTKAKVDGCDLFLICGRVAQATFEKAFLPQGRDTFPHLYIDHPAARRWNREKIIRTTLEIEGYRSAIAL